MRWRGNCLLLGDDDCVVGDGSRAILVTLHGCNLNNSESLIALVTMTMMSFLCCRGSDADLCGVSLSVISALRTSGTQNSEVQSPYRTIDVAS